MATAQRVHKAWPLLRIAPAEAVRYACLHRLSLLDLLIDAVRLRLAPPPTRVMHSKV